MKILHIGSIDDDMANGVTVIVPQYARNQSEQNEVIVYNVNKIPYNKEEKFLVYNSESNIYDILQKHQVDIAVFHGIYFFSYLKIYKILRKREIPYVIVPHCSLTKEAQKQKQILKKVLNTFCFDRFIQSSIAIQYLSETEKKDSSQFEKNSIIIPNGMNVNAESWKKRKKDTFDLLYIGRYAIFQKGLDRLIEACESIKLEMTEKKIALHLYGNDFEDNRRQIEEMVEEKRLSDIISINNPVYIEEKKKKLLNADCFILTSRFEGQPVAILEALSVGLVPIVTEGTTFANIVEENSCGFYAGDDVDSIAKAILKAYDMKDALEDMSHNARKLVEERYEWSIVTKQVVNAYRELLDDISLNTK